MSKKQFYINSISSINSRQAIDGTEGVQVQCNEKQLKAIEPDYKKYIPNATLRRRMSRIIKMGVASAMDCLAKTPSGTADAIITATGLGCLADTGKFMDSLLDNNERLLNPTAFIQSTFNTIGAQIALLCDNHGYNTTYVHRSFSFESALLDTLMLLTEGKTHTVLTGAVDELTPIQFQLMERMGCWRNTPAGEGAQFFVLEDTPTPFTYAILEGVETFINTPDADQIQAYIDAFLLRHTLQLSEIDLVLTGQYVESKLFASANTISFKPLCGEYPTSASYALWMACNLIKEREIKHVLIYNQYITTHHSLYLLKRNE